jgi:RNA polymerase sigma factor (sigma-70 family)
MKTTKPIRVAVVEDDDRLREDLASEIEHQPALRCVGVFANADEALRHLPGIAPDVVMMDIHLGKGMSGIECTQALKAALPDTQVIMLTMFDDSDKIFAALRAGAAGYLLKRFAAGELLPAINQAHAGASPITPQIARQVFDFFRNKEAKAAPAPGLDKLTERERELLSLMARGKQYKEVADHLGISTDTVRSHIRRIYRKLHVHSCTEAVVKFLGD